MKRAVCLFVFAALAAGPAPAAYDEFTGSTPFVAGNGAAARSSAARAGDSIDPREFCAVCGDGAAHSVASVLPNYATLTGLAAYTVNGRAPFAFLDSYPWGSLFNLTPEANASASQTTLTFQATATLGVQIDLTAAAATAATSVTIGDLSVTGDATPIGAGVAVSGPGIAAGTTVSAAPGGSATAWTAPLSAPTTASLAAGTYLTFAVRPAIGAYTLPVVATAGINQGDLVTAASGCIPAGAQVEYYNPMKGEIHLSKPTTALCAASDTLTFTPYWLSQVATGMKVTGPPGAIPSGTTVTAVNLSTGVVTLSAALTGPIYANAAMLTSYWAPASPPTYNFATPVTFYAPYTDAQVAALSMDRLAIQACLNLANGGALAGVGGTCQLPLGSEWRLDGPVILPIYATTPNDGALVALGGPAGSRWGGAVLEATQDFGPGVAAISCGDPTANVGNARGMYAGMTGYYCSGKLRDFRLRPAASFTTAYGLRPQWGGVPVAMDGLFQGARLDTEGVLIEGFDRDIRFVGDQSNWTDTYAISGFFGLYFDALAPNLHSDYRMTQFRAIGEGWAGLGVAANAYFDHAVLDKANFTFNPYGVWCDPSPTASTCVGGSEFENVNAESNGCGWIKDGGIRDGAIGEGFGRNLTATLFSHTLATQAAGSALAGGCQWDAYFDLDQILGLDVEGIDVDHFPVVSGAVAIVRADRLRRAGTNTTGGVTLAGPGMLPILQQQASAGQGVVDGLGWLKGDFCFTQAQNLVRIVTPNGVAREGLIDSFAPALGAGFEADAASGLCNGGELQKAGTTSGAPLAGLSAQAWSETPGAFGHFAAMFVSGGFVPIAATASGSAAQMLTFAGTSQPGAAIAAANDGFGVAGSCPQAWVGTLCWGPMRPVMGGGF